MNTTTIAAVIGAAIVLLALRRTLRRFERASISSQPVILPLLVLPTLLGLSLFGTRKVMIALVLLALLALLSGGRRPVDGYWSKRLLGAVLIAYAIPLIQVPAVDRVLIGLATLAIVMATVRAHDFEAVVSSVIDGVGFFLVVNVLAHLAGIQNPSASARTAGLESTSGGERVFYPLSASLAVPPIMAAAFIAAIVLCFEGSPLRRAFRVVAMICAAVILAGANTRVALVLAVLVGLGVMVAPSILRRLSMPAAILALTLPFTFPIFFQPLIRPTISALTSVIPFLSRGDQVADETLAGRDTIWSIAIEYWRAHADAVYAVFGWGFQGQQSSGASSVYGPRFVGLNSDPRTLTVHSSSLQQLFDAGLVGLIALMAAILMTLHALSRGTRAGSRAHLIGLGVVTTLVLGGATEVTMAPGFAQEPFWIFIAIALAVARRTDTRRGRTAPASEVRRMDTTAVRNTSPGLAERPRRR